MSVTRSVVEAAQRMDFQVLDHLILGQGTFASLLERGLMPWIQKRRGLETLIPRPHPCSSPYGRRSFNEE